MLRCLGYLSVCAVLFGFATKSHAEEAVVLNAPLSSSDDQWLETYDEEFQAGRYEKARDFLESLNERPLPSATSRTEQQKRLGKVYIRLENYDAAIAALTNVIDFPRADRTTALIDRCFAYMQLNLLLDAVNDCSAARSALLRARFRKEDLSQLSFDNQKISFAMVDAELSLRSGQVNSALETLGEAIKTVEGDNAFEPSDYWGLYLRRAQILGSIGKSDEAISAITTVLATMPEGYKHTAFASRAGIFRRLDVTLAVEDWKRAANATDDQDVQAEYYIDACVVLVRAKRSEEAIPLCRKAVEANDTDGYYADVFAQALMQAGDVEAASHELKRSVQLRPRTNFVYHQAEEMSSSAKNTMNSWFDYLLGDR